MMESPSQAYCKRMKALVSFQYVASSLRSFLSVPLPFLHCVLPSPIWIPVTAHGYCAEVNEGASKSSRKDGIMDSHGAFGSPLANV